MINLATETLHEYLRELQLPQPDSHKGQNGKLLIIGGSHLFHAASKWSLDIASKFVDMVFYSSVPNNNELIKEAKQEFWNGIVVERQDLESYLEEADVVLIGPGMERTGIPTQQPTELTQEDWNSDTAKITNYLVGKYPTKKWVIDAGALQMIDPTIITSSCILTPHPKEAVFLATKLGLPQTEEVTASDLAQHLHCTLLLKGPIDVVAHENQLFSIPGGNPGMTKGGTGDVLAGLLAALYCTNSALTATIVSSYINKKAGEALANQVGPFFNSSDLVDIIPQVLWQEIQAAKSTAQ